MSSKPHLPWFHKFLICPLCSTVLTSRMHCIVEKKNLKQSLLPAFWKKIWNAQVIKRTLFNWTKQDKMCKFLRKSSFSNHALHKNRKRNNSTYLMSVGCWVSLVPFSSRQPPTSNWHKISWIDCLFFCFYVVHSLKKRTSSKMCMFCPVKKHSFNLLCVLDQCIVNLSLSPAS